MLRTVLALIAVCLAVPAGIYAKEDCYSCHGRKGMPGYVERTAFLQSVHGLIACSGCHIGLSDYPHGSVKKVNCGFCHFLAREGAPAEQAQHYKLSVHGQAIIAGNSAAPRCQTCHGSHYIYPSADPRSRTSRANIPSLCSSCHAHEFESYRTSIHGTELLVRKNTGAATCFDCHLEHRTPRTAEDAWKLRLIEKCGNCHAEQMNSYRKTFHGKVTRLGYTGTAKCQDCHGAHTILPPSDPASTLSQNNIVDTCRTCHAGATARFTKFYAHAEEHDRARYPELYYVYLFMTALLIGVFSFFLLHTFLWAYRSLKERTARREDT